MARHSRVLDSIFKSALYAWRHTYMFVAGRINGITPDKVVFSSFQSYAYNDNPRYVSEKLHELAPEIKQVWLLRGARTGAERIPDYVTIVDPETRRGLRELATARVWVDNVQKNQNLLFRPGVQAYFNTWHGDRGFKRVGKDNTHQNFKPRTERFCTAMIAGSEFGMRTYRTAFEFEGPVLMDGCPRNDLLISDDREFASRLRFEMGLPEDDGLVLYAPTFRDDETIARQRVQIDLSQTLDMLEAKTGRSWLCLYRAHYRSQGLAIEREDPRFRDLNAWPEMAELLLVSDLIVTDYSSCAGDFILRNKPAILFQPDMADYEQGSRELYVDMASSPFYIARDMNGMQTIINDLSEEGIRENCRQWRAFFGVTETGHASEALARCIIEVIRKSNMSNQEVKT